jgi:hypothetical protein
MLRILSSALGDRFEKFSHASYRVAEGDVEPGLKIERVDALETGNERGGLPLSAMVRTRNLLNEVTDI